MTINDEQIERAVALIKKGSASADYFFERITSPAWIEPLAKAKLFAKPYNAIPRGEGLSFPFWTPGQYLARMASLPEAQPSVVEILKDLPPSDNPRVYEVIADAAVAVPPKQAAELVGQLLRGIQLPTPVLLPEKVGAVICRLADGGHEQPALRLARALLALEPTAPPKGEVDDGDENGVTWLHRRAKGRLDDWHYGSVLDQVVPCLIPNTGQKGFEMLGQLLTEAVRAGLLERTEGPDDYSYIWRPTVEHSESNREDIRNSLVSAVRDAAMLLGSVSAESLRRVVTQLQARQSHIFRRLALFLLRQYGTNDVELVQESLCRPADWEIVGLHPEFELLLAHFFGQLTPEIQREYFEWMEAGPDTASYSDFRKRMDGQRPPKREVDHYRDVWVRDHLGVLRTYLTGHYEQQLAKLEEIGPARQPGLPHYRVSISWRGQTSPLNEEETLALDWPSMIAKVRDWIPPRSDAIDAPSAEGLANSLRQRVTANPKDAVEHLHVVVGIAPRYIAAILEPLRDALKQKGAIDWELLIVFLEQALEQAQVASTDLEQWQWVSRCVASLLNDGFEAGAVSIPIELRQHVWSLLERLAQHPDPTPEHEEEYGGSNMDPATLSLNTVRGRAFHAVIGYALWWRRHLESIPAAAEQLTSGLDELPEVRKVLEQHLDPNVDPSLAVRAVYGQWFPWLALIDESWASDHVSTIFPDQPKQAELFWAAWGTYVVFCRPYSSVREMLRPIYIRAIGALREGMAVKVGMGERPSDHLAEHLMAYYWRGELSLDDELIVSFFQSADGQLRGHALDWIGRTLVHLEDPLTADARQRLKALWEWRLMQELLDAKEMQAFGWWFGSARMDPAWALKQLTLLLGASVLPDPDHLVVEQLARVVSSDPGAALHCLEQMIELAREGWEIHGWRDEMPAILEAGLRSGDTEVNEQAKRIVHRLGALGFRDFRALLKADRALGDNRTV